MYYYDAIIIEFCLHALQIKRVTGVFVAGRGTMSSGTRSLPLRLQGPRPGSPQPQSETKPVHTQALTTLVDARADAPEPEPNPVTTMERAWLKRGWLERKNVVQNQFSKL